MTLGNELHFAGHSNSERHCKVWGGSAPEVVCLCGSTKFKQQFMEENFRLTCEGKIVLSVGFYVHADGGPDVGTNERPSELKIMLDQLHKRKIDLADRIHVINVDNYVGPSTESEIRYAIEHGKSITWMYPELAYAYTEQASQK